MVNDVNAAIVKFTKLSVLLYAINIFVILISSSTFTIWVVMQRNPFLALSIASALAGGLAFPATAQNLSANSAYFVVPHFYAPNSDGDYELYQVRGFYEPGDKDTEAHLYLLPTISLSSNSVQFFNAEGRQFDPDDSQIGDVESIKIAPQYNDDLPNAAQEVGIGYSLSGESKLSYLLDATKDLQGQAPIYPPARLELQLASTIKNINDKYEQQVSEQQKMADRCKEYKIAEVSLEGLSLSLFVDGEELISCKFDDSVSGLPPLYIKSPSNLTVNHIKQGDYNLLVSYEFADSKVSRIDAHFDARQTIRNYLNETQTAITQNKSSGFSIFGLGYRHSRISQSFNHQVQSTTNDISYAKTTIVMSDVDDSMVREFDDTFFPQISLNQAIANHLDAADKTSDEKLKKAHLDYAKALQDNDKLKEGDSLAAAAALASQNYAMFVAQGIRAQVSNNENTTEFRRIINDDTFVENQREWAQARRVSVWRKITIPVEPIEPAEQKSFLGILDFIPFTVPAPTGNFINTPMGPQPQLGPRTTFAIAGTIQGEPAQNQGLVPGMLITEINGYSVTSGQQLKAALDAVKPGDDVNLSVYDGPQNPFQSFTLKATKGPPKSR